MADKQLKALLINFLFQKRKRQIMYRNVILCKVAKRNPVLHILLKIVKNVWDIVDEHG